MTLNRLIKSLWWSIKSCNTESDEGYFLEIDTHYPENLHKLHNELPLLIEKIKIEKNLKTCH